MQTSFVLRAGERGCNRFLSTGDSSSYIAGRPDAILTRHSTFNFGPYQSGQSGFGRLRVFGDELFSGAGCGYNMHPHQNFVICAFVLEGQLTTINTLGNLDQLTAGDYYAFSAGSGVKHCELNLQSEVANIIYVWMIPNQLFLPPSYGRGRYEAVCDRNRIVPLVGNADGAVRISQDVQISRLSSDRALALDYTPSASDHGVYAFSIEGAVRVNDVVLARRDSMGVWGPQPLQLNTPDGNADLLIIETIP